MKTVDKVRSDLVVEKRGFLVEKEALIQEIESRKESSSTTLSFILVQLQAITVKLKYVEIKLTKEKPSVEELVEGIKTQVKFIVDHLPKMVQSMKNSLQSVIAVNVGTLFVKLKHYYKDAMELEKLILDLSLGSAQEIQQKREDVTSLVVEYMKNVKFQFKDN